MNENAKVALVVAITAVGVVGFAAISDRRSQTDPAKICREVR
jgi:hypothetical protein